MALWTPNNISGVVIGWWDPSVATSVTTSSYAGNTTVASIASQIGSYALANGSPAASPEYNAQINSLNVFNCVSNQFLTTSSFVQAQPLTIVVFLHPVGALSSFPVIAQDASGLSGRAILFANRGDLGNLPSLYGGTNNATYGSSLSAGSNYFIVGQFNGATSAVSLNGTVDTLSVNPGTSGISGGFELNDASNYFTGYVGDVVLINGTVTTAVRQQLEGWIAWKWGVQALLPVGHPYKSAAPTGASAYTLAETTGAFAFTGSTLAPKVARKLAESSGSFAFTGHSNLIQWLGWSTLAPGSFAFTGSTATLTAHLSGVAYTLALSSGTFAFTGHAETPKVGRQLPEAVGSFAFTGHSETPTVARKFLEASGAFAFSGSSETQKRAYHFAEASGVFAFSGNATSLTYAVGSTGYHLSLTAGSFTFTGSAATQRVARHLPESSGLFTLAGNAAFVSYGYPAEVLAASVAVTPSSVGTTLARHAGVLSEPLAISAQGVVAGRLADIGATTVAVTLSDLAEKLHLAALIAATDLLIVPSDLHQGIATFYPVTANPTDLVVSPANVLAKATYAVVVDAVTVALQPVGLATKRGYEAACDSTAIEALTHTALAPVARFASILESVALVSPQTALGKSAVQVAASPLNVRLTAGELAPLAAFKVVTAPTEVVVTGEGASFSRGFVASLSAITTLIENSEIVVRFAYDQPLVAGHLSVTPASTEARLTEISPNLAVTNLEISPGTVTAAIGLTASVTPTQVQVQVLPAGIFFGPFVVIPITGDLDVAIVAAAAASGDKYGLLEDAAAGLRTLLWGWDF
jgi:hypothetical protein